MQTIERRANLTVAEFIRDYRDPLKPVILTDATQAWPAGSTRSSYPLLPIAMGRRDHRSHSS